MCQSIQCRVCGKTTWTGCGDHADAVLRRVRRRDRCAGHGGTHDELIDLGPLG